MFFVIFFMNRLSLPSVFLIVSAVLAVLLCQTTVHAQRKARGQKKQLATISGVIEIDKRKDFRITYDEIKTAIRQEVIPQKLPLPSQWSKMVEADRKTWLAKFYESDRGKSYLERQKKKFSEAPAFEVKYNSKGDFVIYDVPPGTYGLRGRIDKEIKGILYGFEVFAKIKVLDDVDELRLGPIPIEVTPLFKSNQPAPELRVAANDGKELNFDLKAYKDHYIFLNFLNTADIAPGYQEQIQKMYKSLGKSHKVKLISIVLDEDKDKAIKWLIDKKYRYGSYGFTEGWDHEVTRTYGVRSTPSGWLISPDADRKIAISQHEFFRLARAKESITELVRDRIEGKDTPTPAKKEDEPVGKEE